MADGDCDAFSAQELVRSVMGDHNGVLERMRHLLEEGRWSDVKFIVGEEPDTTELCAHRLVLASGSPSLAALLYGPQATSGLGAVVRVPDVSPDTFRALLLYLYTDELNLSSVEEAMRAMHAAKKYLLPQLSSRCIKYITSMLTAENVCSVLEFARDSGEQQLADRSLQFLCQHADGVLKQPSFLAASPATVQLVLDQDHLVVGSEADVIDATIRWSGEECRRRRLPVRPASKRQVVKDFLGKMRLLTLTADEFVGVPGLKDVLTPEEYRDVLSYLVKPTSCEVPSTICYSDSHRGVISTKRSVGKPAQCVHCMNNLVTTYMGNFCVVCKKAAN